MVLLAVAKLLSYLGLSLLMGGAVLRWRRLAALPLWWFGLGAGLVLLGGVAEVGSTLSDLGFTAPADVADFLTGTRQGQAALIRVIGAALLLAAEVQGWRWLALGGGLALLWGTATAGHAGERGLGWTLLDALHAGGAAIWVGGVLGLALLTLLRRPASLDAGRGFTPIALACLAVLFVSGGAVALSHVPIASLWPALWGSTWGLALLIKVGLLGLALLAAVLVRRALYARRIAPLWLEGALLLGVLGASGALATQPPPTSLEVQRQVVPVSVELAGQSISGSLVLSGPGDLELRLDSAPPGLSAQLLMTDHPMPAQPLELTGDGSQRQAQTRLWMSGGWSLELSEGGEAVRVPFRY